MEAFTSYLLQFGQLNQQQLNLIVSCAEEEHLKANEILSEAGNISKKLAYVLEGVMMISYYNSKGEEIVHHFVDENHFAVDIESFNYQTASMVYIKAVTDCKLITFSHKKWHDLRSTIIGFDSIIDKVVSKTLLDKVNIIRPMLSVDAKSRYENLLRDYPLLVNRIPLVYIASFLGITASTLSRIRSSFRK